MIKIFQHTLKNGMKILVSEVHTLPIVCSTIWYRVGSRFESDGITGISHFLEHMMFKGSKNFPKGAIDAITLQLGGQNNAFTSYDYTGYYFTFASDRWEVALDIESDRISNLIFDAEEFESEKQVILEELKMGEDNPWEYLRKNVGSLSFTNHPYRHPIIGWRHDVESITIEQMKHYYNRYYQPGNAFIVITGNVDAHSVFKAAEERFGSKHGEKVSPPMHQADDGLRGVIRFHAAKPSHVPRILIGFRSPSVRDEKIYAANLLRYILAEGKTSRLYHRLVEVEKTVSSFAISFEDMYDPYLLLMGAELKEGATFSQVENVIFEEIYNLNSEGIKEEELKKVLRQIEADYTFEQEDIQSLAVNIGTYECICEHMFYLQFIEKVKHVNAEDIMEAAKTILDTKCCTIGYMETESKKTTIFLNKTNKLPPLKNEYGGRRTKLCRYKDHDDIKARRNVKIKLPVHEYKLKNGLTILFCPHNRIPALSISSIVFAGKLENPRGKEGLSYIVDNMLDEGTPTRTHEDIAKFVDNAGANLQTFSTATGSGISLKVLKQDVEKGLALLKDMTFESVFPPDRINHTKSQVLTVLESLEDKPTYVGSREFNRAIYENTPLAHPEMGYHETIIKLGRDEIVNFHKKYFKSTNALLIGVGDMEPDKFLKIALNVWLDIPSGKVPQRKWPILKVQKDSKNIRIPSNDKEQLHIYLGHLGIKRTNPDYYPLLVMDIILGGGPGFTSRIPRKLRDDMGLAYHTYASICSSANIFPGKFVAYIGTSPENRSRAIEGILKEIKTIQNEKVSEEELVTAKEYLTGSFVFKFETMNQIASFMLSAYMLNLGFDYTERFSSLIESVTIDDVIRVARKYLNAECYTLVEAGAVEGVK